MVVVRGKGKRNALTHPHSLGRQMPQLSHGLTDTDTELARSPPEHLRYFLLICTWFWSTHPPAIGKYYHYPHPRNKAIVAALRVRSTADGADVRFPRHVHPRWPEQVETCRTSPWSVTRAEIRKENMCNPYSGLTSSSSLSWRIDPARSTSCVYPTASQTDRS